MKVQIKRFDDGSVVKEIAVKGKSARTVGKIVKGIEINLNHNDFFVEVADTLKEGEE